MSQVRMRVDNAKKGEVATVRAMVTHPMEVMQFKDGKPVEKNYDFINRVEATYNGKKVFEAEMTQAVSQNPFVMFPVKAVEPGTVEVKFHDTQGKTYVGKTEIKF
ncbi:MAG TPA: thiosulfate oxidation carrier complex protein SoxZ [Burkholderiaceae bacterium]|jgi:sulfur-oxidizing protein SoxZ|nr:thiosulfate oxidation carrier complex protein SoxZ [Burkholderiaceae bacterium]